LTDAHRTAEWPDRNTEYLFYQTLVGTWPISTDRLTAYMQKATREAKVHTTWTLPNAAYDAALARFVGDSLADPAFTDDVRQFVQPLVGPGRINGLAQILIKLTAPGVPDLYQGSELWDLRLVDPDNRHLIDYDQRRRALTEVEQLTAETIWRRADDGLPKMWVVSQALQVRRRRAFTFGAQGAYTAMEAKGPYAAHVVAFRRGADVVTVVPRLVLGSSPSWPGTTIWLPKGVWHNALTKRRFEAGAVPVADLWREFPVALLERVDA
jgi:(1->4)-alpha-D-glucan 1-alpha-D-glucosylmutase